MGEVKAAAEISIVEVVLEADVVVETVVAGAVKLLLTWKDVAEEYEISVARRENLLAVYTKGVAKAASLGQKMIATVD